ncbi:MAG: hypothetical protein ACM3ZV_13580 [Bacillota bacterium]
MELWKKLGCVAAFFVWLIVSFPFLFALAWSGAHCDPIPQCQRANERHFGLVLLGVAVVAGLTGFIVARVLNAIASRRDDEGASAGFFGLAIIGTLITAVLVIMATYAIFDRVMT